MTIKQNSDYVSVLLYSYYTTVTGWEVFLRDLCKKLQLDDFFGGARVREAPCRPYQPETCSTFQRCCGVQYPPEIFSGGSKTLCVLLSHITPIIPR